MGHPLLSLSGLGQGADGTGGKSEFHTTDALGLEVNRKRPASVALGVADLVTGLSSSAGELANARHRSNDKSCLQT